MKSGLSHKALTNWYIPVGLILLGLIPVAAGLIRLFLVMSGDNKPENLRYLTSPGPLVIHIISVTFYSLLGAFQFWPSFRQQYPHWHRIAGKILIPFAFATVLTGLWMTRLYPSAPYDGTSLVLIRYVVGVTMLFFLFCGVRSIFVKDYTQHGAWMIRAYALALGAGTQVMTHLPWFLFPSLQNESTRALLMGLGWVINAIAAEWIIRRRRKLKQKNNQEIK